MTVLILGLAVLTIISYIVARGDFINPVFITCVSFLFASLCALYNEKIWEIDLGSTTISLILVSLAVMIVTEGFYLLFSDMRNLNPHRKLKGAHINIIVQDTIRISDLKLVILLFYAIVVLILMYTEITKLGGGSTGSLSGVISTFRKAEHFTTDKENQLSFMVSQLFQLLRVFSYTLLFVMISNTVVLGIRSGAVPKRQNRLSIAIIAISILCNLLTGSRMYLLKLLIAGLIVYIVIQRKANGKMYKVFKPKQIIAIVIIFVATIYAFIAVRNLLGRNDYTDPIYYFTKYTGGSIALLDLFVKQPIAQASIWGKETFYSFYNFIGGALNIDEYNYVFAKEFRWSNGVIIGNVYTALRAFYYDFGFWGCVLSTSFIGIIAIAIYRKILAYQKTSVFYMPLLLYAYFFNSIAFMGINYYFGFVPVELIKVTIFFAFAKLFLFRVKVHQSINTDSGVRTNV